jgi:hypothetical protein
MVKYIKDPNEDESGVSMRSLRASRAFNYIKKRKTKTINEKKLDEEELDPYFNKLFSELDINIKQELIWLWNELGEVYNELMEIDNKPPKIIKKSKPKIFGP